MKNAAPYMEEDWDWSRLRHVWSSSGGSGGVLLCEMDGPPTKVVVKGTGEPARELFASAMMRLLLLHPPPALRPISPVPLLSLLPSLLSGESLNRALRPLRRPLVLLSDFVSGHSLLDLAPNDPRLLHSTFLFSLGQIMAFDVLVNNLDRMPLPIWSNEGNLGNVMVSDSPNGGGPSAVPIDNSVFPIRRTLSEGRPNPQHQAYLDRVKDLLDNVQGAVQVMRDRCLNFYGVELGSAQVIAQGMVSSFAKLAALDGSVFARQKQAVESMVKEEEDQDHVWQRDCQQINVEFLQEVHSLIKAKYTA